MSDGLGGRRAARRGKPPGKDAQGRRRHDLAAPARN